MSGRVGALVVVAAIGSACGSAPASQPVDAGPSVEAALTCAPITLASGQDSAVSIVVDATSVYWSNRGSIGGAGGVSRAPIAGIGHTILASGLNTPTQIAVDATSVYWAEDYSYGSTTTFKLVVRRLSLQGGDPVDLAVAPARPLGALVIDGTSVYWSAYAGSQSLIMKVPLAGGAVVTVATDLTPITLAVDATNLYWGNGDMSTPGSVMMMPLAGGDPTVLASGPGPLEPWRIAVDANSVYWTDWGTHAVMKVPIGGGDATALVPGESGPEAIAVDATSVYWSTYNALWKAPLAGGTPILLADRTAFGIALDDENVYWTAADSVLKCPK